MNIVATNKNLSQRHHDGRSDECPCCTIHVETAEHVLLCPAFGLVEAFQLCTSALEWWLDEVDTDLDLTDSILEYVGHNGGGNNLRSTQVQTHVIITGYDRVETVPGGDDINGDHKHSAAIHCC